MMDTVCFDVVLLFLDFGDVANFMGVVGEKLIYLKVLIYLAEINNPGQTWMSAHFYELNLNLLDILLYCQHCYTLWWRFRLVQLYANFMTLTWFSFILFIYGSTKQTESKWYHVKVKTWFQNVTKSNKKLTENWTFTSHKYNKNKILLFHFGLKIIELDANC